MNEPIAVVGSACRFPGDTNTPSKLWELLQSPRDLCIPVPSSRFKPSGFYHKNSAYHGHSNVEEFKSYYLSEEAVERQFDAGFFGINPAEANVLDPQLRLLLETTYEALEAAGQTMEVLRGSDTGCYVGLMMGEYEQFMMRDVESIGTYHIMGTARSLMSNRLSYFFDWHGPSMTIDTACSSSLVAVHQAVQQLRSGQSRVVVAAGANLILDPITHISESKLQMLSPDGRGRMWDADANGYARGEGVATVVLKKLSDALADGDDVECIIRETGVNQDGKTRGITLPSAAAQAALIRDTYRRAGLDPLCAADRPQYFEAHGTGTPAGDPIEAAAIHAAFFGDEAAADDGRLWVGSIKTVCGHTEGTAGIAGLMKASLALQRAVVPPNLLFTRLNPRIEPFAAHLQVPRRAEPWPVTASGQPRRAAVNNFGFGGTNCFALLESCDAADSPQPPATSPPQPSATPAHVDATVPFVFSAASEKALSGCLEAFAAFVEANEQTLSLRHVAHTLHTRRSRLQYATAVAAADAGELSTKLREKLQAASSGTPVGVRAQLGRAVGIVGIFTGQGAQWPRMGAELLQHSPVAAIVADLEGHLARLPPADRPQWSLRQELERSADSSRVGEAELSQPLCTALQIVLVDLVRAAGITFTAVVGHSSGEIGAAYAADVLSAHDAIAIAYYRGLHTKLAGSEGHKGAMLAAGITADDASELLDSPVFEGRATIAAYNASSSLTLAGNADAIEELQIILEDEDKFARLLKVDKAYHSHHMAPVAGPYANSLHALNIKVSTPTCTWISSVSGKNILDHGLDSLSHQYWVDNAVNPVLFMQAVQKTFADLGPTTSLLALELGPHPALQGPALQTIRETTAADIPYTGLLKRGARDSVAVAEGLGHIWTHLGQPSLDLHAFDHFLSDKSSPRLVKDLPTYAWDHHVDYWHESRYTKATMSRPRVHELLGHLISDASVDQDLRWRQILSPAEIPWLGGHRLQSQIVFPAAGYVVLAIEACRELLALAPAFGTAKLIQVHDVNIQQALTFDSDDSRVEAIFALNNITREADIVSANFKYAAASSGTGHGLHNDSQLRVLTSGYVKISLGEPSPQTLPARAPSPDSLLPVRAEEFYESLERMEYEYSGEFRALSNLKRKLGAVTGRVAGPSKDLKSELLVHPGMLDAAFQAVLLAKTAPFDGSLWSMHVPKTIDRITVNPCTVGSHITSGQQLPFSSYLQNRMANSFKGDVDVYPPQSHSSPASDESSHAMVQVEGLNCVPFSPSTAQDDRELMSVMVWDSAFPDAAKAAYDLSPIPDPREIELARFLERLSFYYLKHLQDSIPLEHPSRVDGQPLSKLFSFAKHVESRIASGQVSFWKEEWFQDTQATIAAASKPFADVADYKLLTRIGGNLPDVVEGKTSAIELTMKDDLLNDFYPVALGMAHHTKYLARIVKQITHRYPHMNILEIGAGTGGATKAILDTVGDSFSSYTFTDISAGFFLRAQEHFSPLPSSSRLAYKVLDISKDPLQQGFAEKTYDLIVASQVLHATPVMRQSLLNTRRLLKPGGYLIVNEGINNDTARLGTIFGAFPGWWLGAENDGRNLGPNLAVSEWDELLRGTGFSGCDSQVPVVDPLLTPNTVLVSQAVDARVNFLRDPLAVSPQALQLLDHALEPSMQELLIVSGEKSTATEIVRQLALLLKKYFAKITRLRSLADVAALNVHVSSQTTILSLSDIDKPMFRDLTDHDLRSMKYILHNAGSVLWITQGRRAQDPFANMTVGLVRAALLEIPTLAFQFLDFEDVSSLDSRAIGECLLRFKAGLAWAPRKDNAESGLPLLTTVEREFVLNKEGQTLIPRIIPKKDLNDRYNAARRPIYATTSLQDREGSQSNVHNVTVRFDAHRKEYYLDQVRQEIDSDSLHLTYSLLLACRIEGLGYAHIGLARGKGSLQVIVSSQLSPSIPPLKTLSRVLSTREETLLRDSEVTAQFLQLVAGNILTMDIFSGSSHGDHVVLYEPEPAFAMMIKREAARHQVDVTVLSSTMSRQRCELLGWLCIHPQAPARIIRDLLPKDASVFLICSGGRQRDVVDSAARISSHLPPRCKVTSIAELHGTGANADLGAAGSSGLDLPARLDKAIRRALEDLHHSSLESLVIPIDQISDVNVAISSGNDDRARHFVLQWESALQAQVRIQPIDDRNMFSDSKTYWLAGLTGSLGLSLCEWMIEKGAKYIVMTSRKPNVSRTWQERMASLGAVVKVHSNDLTNLEQTKSFYLDICSAMPPVGGVASAAMVLVDTTLSNMALEDMETVCRPKVQGTLNLDKIFHNVDLEFYIAFSSIVAVTGNPGQSNYAAANMFMTSLVEQRRQRGLAASVIHIAPILGVGYVTEKSDRNKTNFPRTTGYSLTSEQDFHNLFAEAVLAGSTHSESDGYFEIALGLQKVGSNPEKPPYWFDNPTATHFIRNDDTADVSKTSVMKASVKSLLLLAKSTAQISQVMTDSLKPFICSLFQIQGGTDLSDSEFLDLSLDDIGLDSLLAVEIRTWFLKTVNVNLPVMKILSGLSVRQLIAITQENLSTDLIPNVVSGAGENVAQRETPSSQKVVVPKETKENAESVVVISSSSDTDGLDTAVTTDTDTSSTPASKSPPGTPLEGRSSPITVTRIETTIERFMELSFSQTMFWFVLKFLDNMAGLNHTGAFKITGRLRVRDLERAIVDLANRHEVLRTCFRVFDDRPQQGIMETGSLCLERRQITSEEEVTIAARELQEYTYDLESGECLRVLLLELSSNVHFLLYGTHSLVMDGISGTILTRDLLQLYENEPESDETAPAFQYSAFVRTQHEAFSAGKLEDSLQFWREELTPCPSPLPVLRISPSMTRPVQTSYQNCRKDLAINAATISRIRDVCRRCKVRPFHFFLTVFRVLLSRFAEAEEVCIGIADANRSHEGAMDGLGPYINLLPLRFSNSALQRFEAELQKTKAKSNSALAHSDIPFQLLLNDLGVSRSATHAPIFQAFFDYRQGMRKTQTWGECELELLSFQASELPYDISLDIIDDAGNDTCHLMLLTRGDMYGEENVRFLLRSYENLIHSLLSTPNAAFADPDIFDTEDVERALQHGRGESIPSQWSYPSIFGRVEAMANSNPNEVALKLPFGGKFMTYTEMLAKAQGIALVLRAEGCTTGSIVAVYQEPTPDWLCSVLGVFSSGAVCVPFDAGTLVKRLADMADNSNAQYILVDSSTGNQATEQLNTDGTRKIINVERVSASAPDNTETADSLPLPRAEDPAMILYTSGSTGVPKGIVLKHGGFRNWAEFVPPMFRSGDRDTVLQQSSSGFDMAYLQAFFALAYGGTVCIVPRAMRVDARTITQIIATEGVTVTQGVPSEYSNWLRYGDSESLATSTHWRTAMCGGEPGTNIVLELQAALGPQPRPRFFHMYGPTEITFITTAMELFYGDDEKTPAVGGPFPNYSVYVLDDQFRPVPPGVQGEIYIGGAGVASGYLGNAVLTEEKFLPDPYAPASFKSRGWATMHRTGDNGRWRKDGGLLIEGRRSSDTQHKLRGLRIDLQEIENVMLKESNGILTDVVVTVSRTSPQSPEFLVAHVRFDPNHCPVENDQQHFLSELSSNLPLPQYMWPSVAIAVQELPMMSSGKLDRRAVASLSLPELANSVENGDEEETAAAILTETEARLKKMWQDIIPKDVSRRHRIRLDTDFFHVGGTSILLLRLQSQIQKSFGFDFPFAEMFEGSTLGAMSKRIDDKRASEAEFFDWEVETAIPESLLSALENITHPPLSRPTKVVVLTGATGLLGQGFLKALIRDASIDKIHCVALRNIRTRISSLPLLAQPKVVLHEGDLSLPRLGLDEATATLVFQEADRIIHNGADTSHLKTYRSLRAVNLQATQEIVSMCLLAGKQTPVHYVSTASILQYSGLSEFDEESAAHYPPPPDAFDGYSASKWASERYLEKVHQHSDDKWPIWIHRPTSVQRSASASQAEPNNLDVVSNLLKYCKLANAVPVSPNLRGYINLTQLDDVVASMMAAIHITTHPNQEHSPMRYLHERGTIDIPFDDIKSFIDAATGRNAEELVLDEWVRHVAKLGMDKVLVAYFETVRFAPPVVWQRLLKKGELRV